MGVPGRDFDGWREIGSCETLRKNCRYNASVEVRTIDMFSRSSSNFVSMVYSIVTL